MSKVVTDREMQVPAGTLFKVITDFESYPEFVSEVVAVKIEPGGKPEKTVVHFELELVKRFEYSLEFNIKEPNEVSWKLLKSNFFKVNDGRWLLKPAGANSTQVTYELEVGFGFLVPSWISRKLTEVNLPKMLENFENRAKKVGK